jgi:glucose-6-phosphate isomerase
VSNIDGDLRWLPYFALQLENTPLPVASKTFATTTETMTNAHS